jgi:Protein of unknown function (DUF3800)
MASKIVCYLDESGTHGSSPTAVVGGLLLQADGFFWLDVAWQKALEQHGIEPPLHMKEFVPNGEFKDIRHDARRSLFSDLVKIINEHKINSIAATLDSAQYTRHFSQVFSRGEASMYGFCFLLLAVAQGKYAEAGNHKDRIPFVLDSGNEYRRHVVEIHSFLRDNPLPRRLLSVGGLEFDEDQKVRALQAADLVAWSARRRITGAFNNGFEPLVGIFDDRHIEESFDAAVMDEIANDIRSINNALTDGT